MKKVCIVLIAAGLLTATATSLVSCREKSTVEKVADDVEDAVD